MKLTDITTVEVLAEGHVEPNALLALQHVAERGRITNAFEMLVLGKFAQLVKNGDFYNEANPLFTTKVSISPALVAAIKTLKPEELQAFASNIYNVAACKNGPGPTAAPLLSPTDWIKLYTAREATD
jgi:hypothetical protein